MFIKKNELSMLTKAGINVIITRSIYLAVAQLDSRDTAFRRAESGVLRGKWYATR